jgi:hypothetical protein
MVVAKATSDVGGGAGVACAAAVVVGTATVVVVGGTGTMSGPPPERSAHPITADSPNTNTPDAPAVAILANCAGGSGRRPRRAAPAVEPAGSVVSRS